MWGLRREEVRNLHLDEFLLEFVEVERKLELLERKLEVLGNWVERRLERVLERLLAEVEVDGQEIQRSAQLDEEHQLLGRPDVRRS